MLTIFILLSLTLALSAIGGAGAAGVVGKLIVGGAPQGLVYDMRNGDLYVTNLPTSTVSVISTCSNASLANVTVGNSPSEIAYDSGMKELFVTNLHSSTVSVLSDTTNGLITNITVGQGPLGIVYDREKGKSLLPTHSIARFQSLRTQTILCLQQYL